MRKWEASCGTTTTTKPNRKSRRSMTRPTRPRSSAFRTPRKNTIHGVLRGPRIRPKSPSKRQRPEFQSATIRKPDRANPISPTNISLLGPTCPCNALPSPLKKVDVPKSKDSSPPRRADKQPPKRARGADDDVVVYRRPPPPDMYEPAPSIGIGIGIGGGFGGGERGGGMPGRRGGY